MSASSTGVSWSRTSAETTISPGARKRGQSRREVDAAAVDVVLVGNQLADVGAHPEQHLAVGRHADVAFVAGALDREGRPYRRLDAGEFEHQPVAHAFDQTAGMGRKDVPLHRCYELPPSPHRVALVAFHEPDGFHQIDEQHRPYDPLGVVVGGGSVL